MQVRFFNKEGWQENKFHFHDHVDILLMMSDGGDFYVQNKVYPIGYGNLLILNAEELHRNVPEPGSFFRYYSIRFYPEEITAFSPNDFDIMGCFRNHEKFNHQLKLRSDQLEHLLKLINKMEHYLQVDCEAYGKSVYIKTLLAETLVFINFLYNVPSNSRVPKNDKFTKLKPVLSYIQDHIAEELTLDILAEQLFISKYHLSHIFTDIMGTPLSGYIIKQRLTHAKKLLRQGCLVTLAGDRSGFNSSAHFIRTFVKNVGLSPKQYAKQYLSLEEYDSPSPVHRDVFVADHRMSMGSAHDSGRVEM